MQLQMEVFLSPLTAAAAEARSPPIRTMSAPTTLALTVAAAAAAVSSQAANHHPRPRALSRRSIGGA